MVKNSCLYSSCLKVNRRSDNSFAKLNDGRFIKMDKFIVDFNSGEEYTLCNVVNTVHHNLSKNYDVLRRITQIDETVCMIKTSDIKTICVFIETFDISYICPLPNLLFY